MRGSPSPTGGTGFSGWYYRIALASGLVLDRRKARRTVLPLVHGLANLALLILALVQVWTGFLVLKVFVL